MTFLSPLKPKLWMLDEATLIVLVFRKHGPSIEHLGMSFLIKNFFFLLFFVQMMHFAHPPVAFGWFVYLMLEAFFFFYLPVSTASLLWCILGYSMSLPCYECLHVFFNHVGVSDHNAPLEFPFLELLCLPVLIKQLDLYEYGLCFMSKGPHVDWMLGV